MSHQAATAVATDAQSTPALATKPPPPASQENRILVALALARGPLPCVSLNCLVRYHRYLAANLRFPFEARCPEESGLVRPWTSIVTVTELLPPVDLQAGDDRGLLCKALRSTVAAEIPLIDLEVDSEHSNAQLIEDYWYWFWNWRFDPRI